ncbi:MAG: sugar transferase [Clostridia bacterium]|nr:sugar transferase [Clostridia bacterium]
MYAKFFKRFFDLFLSVIAFAALSPFFLILTVIGAIVMKGNPFFLQARPGKKDKNGKEKIFKLIKFRTMSNAKDEHGDLLPDDKRLTKYGSWLRSTSLDELPELLNIIVGHLSICGPRPLLVAYLPRYTEEQRRRHDVRPGLTGYAQAYGRNSITWEEKFEKDVYYVDHLSFLLDVKIIFKTVSVVMKREGISSETSATMEEFMGSEREYVTNE